MAAWHKANVRRVALALLALAGPTQAYEIASLVPAGTAEYRGFSLVPSQNGRTPTQAVQVPEFKPVTVAGQAVLDFIELRVATGTTPPGQLLVYTEIPAAADAATGNGALAQAPLEFCGTFPTGDACRYNFDPVAVPFDETAYIVFSECATLVVSAIPGEDDYPAGAPLTDSQCSDPAAGIISPQLGDDNAAFIAAFLNPSPNLVAEYVAGNNGESLIPGAPVLQGFGLAQTSSAMIDGRRVTTHPMGGGLTLDVENLLTGISYTVVMLVKLDSVRGLQKMLDLNAGRSDLGLYVFDGGLNFVDVAAGDFGVIPVDTWVQLVIQRSRFQLTGVIDDAEQFRFFDDDERALVGADSELRFFVDDLVTGGRQTPSGEWARIRVFNSYLELNELEKLSRLRPVAQDRFENDNRPLRADLGTEGSDGFFRTFDTSTDEDWIYGGVPCDVDNDWSSVFVEGLMFRSDDSRFQPLIEIYPQEALVVPNTPPSMTLGQCGQPGPLFVPGLRDAFARIRNCPEQAIDPSEPLRYRIDGVGPDTVVCAPGIRISGEVTEASSSLPVGGVFVIGDENSAGFSAPGTGRYQILVTDFEEMTLNVVSEQWEADPVVVPTTTPGFGITVDIQVARKGGLFDDSFEIPDDPFSP
ncbi:MAG: hypothetical protein AAGA23_00520 [Pseudomonadota bacterium]